MVKEPMIIKRDGSSAAFDKFKIKDAILKAMKYGSGIYIEDIANKISSSQINLAAAILFTL